MRDYQLVQVEASVETLRRIIWLALLTIPLHFSLAWWFGQLHAPLTQPELQTWADALSRAHLQTGVLVVVLTLGALGVRRGGEGTAKFAIIVQLLVCVTYLVLGINLSGEDMRAGNGLGVTAFILIFVVVASQFLLRPLLSVPIYLAALVSLLAVLHATPMPANTVLGIYVNAIAVALMGVVVSVTVWHQYVRTVLIQRELSEKNGRLEFLACCDELTGLLNRREFMRLAQLELDRAGRYPTDTSLIVLDLDNFKDINDQYGHPAGDAALQRVAAILTQGVRVSDLVGRLGGEEFVVLAPHADQARAQALAEKLRQMLATDAAVASPKAPLVTASFGVSSLASHQKASLEDMYQAADTALYRAKNLGRNRVEVAPVTPKPVGSE